MIEHLSLASPSPNLAAIGGWVEEEKLSSDNRIVSQRRITSVLHNSATAN